MAGQIEHNLPTFATQNHIPSNPGFWVEKGNTFFLCIFIILIVICWFVKYPDIVTTKAKLTSVNAPKTIVAKTEGVLVKLFVKEGEITKRGNILGYIESTADHGQIIRLSGNLDTLLIKVTANQLSTLSDTPFSYDKLGELQQYYQIFAQQYLIFRTYLSKGFYLRKKAILENDLTNLLLLHNTLIQKKELQARDLVLAQATFKAQQQLNEEHVISPFDYRDGQSKLIGKELVLPQIEAEIINSQDARNAKLKEIMELDNAIVQQKAIFLQFLNTFISQLADWKRKYLIISPLDGKVTSETLLLENIQLKNEQVICHITPDNSEYYMETFIPQDNFGKIRIGQDVLLKFPSFPSEEYGVLKGKINFISRIATDSGYFARISLPPSPSTSYHKHITYRHGLTAEGQIITQNKRLLERFFNSMLKSVQ
jgi:multidrug efflux pump subunit AcrA (membrane-fusion protein)